MFWGLGLGFRVSVLGFGFRVREFGILELESASAQATARPSQFLGPCSEPLNPEP